MRFGPKTCLYTSHVEEVRFEEVGEGLARVNHTPVANDTRLTLHLYILSRFYPSRVGSNTILLWRSGFDFECDR